MRIVFITNNYTPYSGGVVSSINATTHALQQAGHTVSIIAPGFLDEHNDPEYVYRVTGPIRFRYKGNHMMVPWRPHKQVLQITQQLKPDVIHVHHPFGLGKIGARVARALNVPVIFTYHTLYQEYVHYVPLPQFVIKPLVTKAVLSFCNAVDGIVAPSGAVQNYLASKNINTPVIKIPSGLQDMYVKQISTFFKDYPSIQHSSSATRDERGIGKQFLSKELIGEGAHINSDQTKDTLKPISAHPAVSAEALCEDWKCREAVYRGKKDAEDKQFNLLFIGRFAKEKNIPFLLDMFAQLSQDYILTMVGYGPIFEHIKRYAFDALKLDAQRVHFIHKPNKKELPKLYAQADVFLFPSHTDTQGLVLAEAMACGTPVIALQGPGQKDIIEQGVNGFIVADQRQMIATIEQIKHDEQLQEVLCKGAMQTGQKYDPKKLVAKLVNFYEKIKQ